MYTNYGYLKDYSDMRDHHPDHPEIAPLLAKTALATTVTLPSRTDLRTFCNPVRNQATIGSCTGHASTGLIEVCLKKTYGKTIDCSPLFQYKITRNFLKWSGDTGAFLRSAMGSLALFGVVPETYWPYVVADYEKEPTAFVYAMAQNFQALKYYRLDTPGLDKNTLLQSIKNTIAYCTPVMFGFTVYKSIANVTSNGLLPFPTSSDAVAGGHAVLAVGYDDSLQCPNASTRGALLVRNSWGKDWGEAGYFWMPYDYVLRGLADDWWTVTSQEWVDTGAFMP